MTDNYIVLKHEVQNNEQYLINLFSTLNKVFNPQEL